MSTPATIVYHWCALKGAIKLEKKGLRRRGQSAKAIAIAELGLKKNSTHDEVIEALQKKIDDNVDYHHVGIPPSPVVRKMAKKKAPVNEG
jgi:hypothetical protein